MSGRGCDGGKLRIECGLRGRRHDACLARADGDAAHAENAPGGVCAARVLQRDGAGGAFAGAHAAHAAGICHHGGDGHLGQGAVFGIAGDIHGGEFSVQFCFHVRAELDALGEVGGIRSAGGDAAGDAVLGNECGCGNDLASGLGEDVPELQQGIIVSPVAVDHHGNGRVAVSLERQQPLGGNGGNAPTIDWYNGQQGGSCGDFLWLHGAAEVNARAHAGTGNGGGDFGTSSGRTEYGGNPVAHIGGYSSTFASLNQTEKPVKSGSHISTQKGTGAS